MYCLEEGECLIWNQGTNSVGYPIARLEGSSKLVRRYVYTNLMKKHLPRGYKVTSVCGNIKCVSTVCLRGRPMSAIVRQAYEDGKRNTYQEKMKRRESCIRTFGAKLNMDKAREIRGLEGSHQEIADRYGVSRSTVKNIKLGVAWAEPSNTSIFNWKVSA